MDRILKILKKENGPRASSAPALELNTITFKHVYWYMLLISGERLQAIGPLVFNFSLNCDFFRNVDFTKRFTVFKSQRNNCETLI